MRYLTLLLVLTFVVPACSPTSTPAQFPTVDAESPEAEIRDVVENFGARLQMVSLLAPDAASQIEVQYGEFVAQDLLQSWMEDPELAPGRLTSSPWPDRIEVESVEALSSEEYLVKGTVIEITSAEIDTDNAAAQYPVDIIVSSVNGNWLITGWQAGDYQL